MAKEDIKDLAKFLQSFPAEVQETALWLREFVWELYPKANELIYDNYNALAFGWSVTDRLGHCFCNIAVGRSTHNIHYGFYYGADISDPEKRLVGNGNQYRYLLVKTKAGFPKTYLKKLLKEAHTKALAKVKDKKQLCEGLTIMKSISEKKRSPGKKKIEKTNIIAKKKPAKK